MMPRYQFPVYITETRFVEVDAEDAGQAYQLAKEKVETANDLDDVLGGSRSSDVDVSNEPELVEVPQVNAFYASADGPGTDATWSVYRETYAGEDATEPIDELTIKIATYAGESAADLAANTLGASMR